MGEGISPETQKKIIALAEKDEAVVKVVNILSTYQSPQEIMLILIINFEDDLDTVELTNAIDRIRDSIKKEYQLVEFLMIQPQTYLHH